MVLVFSNLNYSIFVVVVIQGFETNPKVKAPNTIMRPDPFRFLFCQFARPPYVPGAHSLAKNSHLQCPHLAMPQQVAEIKECAITLPNCCALKKTFLFNT